MKHCLNLNWQNKNGLQTDGICVRLFARPPTSANTRPDIKFCEIAAIQCSTKANSFASCQQVVLFLFFFCCRVFFGQCVQYRPTISSEKEWFCIIPYKYIYMRVCSRQHLIDIVCSRISHRVPFIVCVSCLWFWVLNVIVCCQSESI